MSRNRKDDEIKLAALDRFMVDQILGASEEEMLEQGEPGDIERSDEAFRKAKLAVGKSNMDSARGAVAASKASAPIPSRTNLPDGVVTPPA